MVTGEGIQKIGGRQCPAASLYVVDPPSVYLDKIDQHWISLRNAPFHRFT
jgi:hypothetical protein